MDNNNLTPQMTLPNQPQPQPQPQPQIQSQPQVQPQIPAAPAQPVMPAPAPVQPMDSVAPHTASRTQASNDDLKKTIVIIILAIVSVAFIGLFVWMLINYLGAKSDVDSQISVAVAEAKSEQAEQLESEFAEREKSPYSTFAGPSDYGELTFNYPKTWSVYIAKDASNGGNFEAYLNPGGVNPVSNSTINALRVTIRDKGFDDVVAEYQKAMDKKGSDLTMNVIKVNNTTANRYTGTIPSTELKGFIVVVKIRDKTAIIQTDSQLFESDFNKVIESITFNA